MSSIHHHGEHVHVPLDQYLTDGLDEHGLLRLVNVLDWAERTRMPLPVSGVERITGAPIMRSAELTGEPHPETGSTDSATLGVDMLYVPAGAYFPPHVHPGHHLLMSVRGLGTVTYGEEVIPVRRGDLYFILADVAHAVGSDPDGPGHWLLSFGAPHKRVEAADRMRLLAATEAALEGGDPGTMAAAERELRALHGRGE